MEKTLGKSLRLEFDKRIKFNFSDFELVPEPGAHFWPGERVYVSRKSEMFWSVLVMSPNPNGTDSFTLEIGWSRKGRLPQLAKRPSTCPPKNEIEAIQSDEYVTRLGYLCDVEWEFIWLQSKTMLMDEAGNQRAIDSADSEPRRGIDPALDFVLAELSSKGIPFLTAAEQHGSS